jgi:hypothetical protein
MRLKLMRIVVYAGTRKVTGAQTPQYAQEMAQGMKNCSEVFRVNVVCPVGFWTYLGPIIPFFLFISPFFE